jgi:parallel beta-helix repeat protein
MTWKLLLLIILTFLPVASVSFSLVKTAMASDYTDVSVSEARALIETNPSLVLLDVRNQSEYDAGHIRNAKLIPLWELATRLNELNKTDEILVYCGVGGRSINASRILASDDFSHVYNMLGGTTEWIREGYPVYIKYLSVQEAINNASAGDTIHVSAGLYIEPLTVNKSLALEGENRYTTIINAAANSTVHVNADNVSISDFTLQCSGGCACAPFSVLNVTGCRDASVTNNVIVSDNFGIRVEDARKLTIAHNNAIAQAGGMELDNCTESVFSGNTIFSISGPGVFAYESHQNTFSGNEIIANASTAISISNCYNNTFLGNNISSNDHYVFFWFSNNNSFFQNNFLGNGGQLSAYGSSIAFWDNGFEGNCWSSYTGVDADLDGIWDAPHFLDSNNKDNYPLAGMFHNFKTPPNYDVGIVSDSAISGFDYLGPNQTIRLQISNTTANQTVGFCRMSIPHGLIDPYNDSISVVIDDGLTPVLFLNNTLYDNGTHRWIYFTYPLSTHEVLIVPEFPAPPILSVFMAITIITGAWRRRHQRARGTMR